MKVYQLLEVSCGVCGCLIVNLLLLEVNECIIVILLVCEYEEGVNVFMVIVSGIVKKMVLIEFSCLCFVGIIVVNFNDGDELIGVDLIFGFDEVMLFLVVGKVVCFKEDVVCVMGCIVIGVCGIKLVGDDKVVFLIILCGEGVILIVM